MTEKQYDAIVVGARCAGSPTAMLLARKGYNVLVVDRATFPSDTMSTHIVHPPGVAALAALGPARSAGRRPDVRRSTRTRSTSGRSRSPASPGHRRLAGRVLPAPHRARQAARRRGVRGGRRGPRGFTVEDVVVEDGRVTGIRGHGKGGQSVTEHASVVVGADGRYSHRRQGGAARAVQREAADPVRLLHATGAACPWTAASRCTSDRTGDGRRRRPTTT